MDRTVGRRIFGDDPAGYHAARPDYPRWVFEVLHERCGLAPGFAAFEIGAGTGKATRPLLELGARRLVAVEPDQRLADFLRRGNPHPALAVVTAPFETAELDEAGFDLGLSATAFHWLEEDLALEKVARLLAPGGLWTMVWNLFGDTSRPDPFHDATAALLGGELDVSAEPPPFGLDIEARTKALLRAGAFEAIVHRAERWDLVLDPAQTRALYATYSNINIRPDREAVLDELERVAREVFGGRVVRNMVTILYTARRR
jgi:SAM-dependent methyltransferase